jgi:hypothetical protein
VPSHIGEAHDPVSCATRNALLIQWSYGRSARASALAIPDVESPRWSTRRTAGWARTAGMGNHMPGAVSHAAGGLLTAALAGRRGIPLRHQGPALVVSDAFQVIPLRQQRIIRITAWALYHAAMGMARTPAGRARLAAFKAKRHGDRYAGFKAIVELAAKVLRVVWGVWRSGTPYDPRRTGGLRRQPR